MKQEVCPYQKPLDLLGRILDTFCALDPTEREVWVLDACCGTGSLSVAAGYFGFSSCAFDSDPRVIEIARNRILNPTIYAGPDEELLTETEKKAANARARRLARIAQKESAALALQEEDTDQEEDAP